jgi:hypothetical protein
MPFAGYTNFADCVSKNKSKRSPDAYCGYIKNQVEGGKKEEECLESPEHEAYHLEEEIKRMEEEAGAYVDICPMHQKPYANHSQSEKMQDSGTSAPEELPRYEETDRQSRMPKGVRHTLERMGPEEWAPEPELEKAKAEFLDTLKATIDAVTLVAKDVGYHDVSEKVSPTPSTYMQELHDGMADVFVKQSKGFGVEVNWFNATLDELRDIVKDADKFFIDSGWNSKETVKEYEKHKKKWGKDFD